jgi:hypothetical protein
VKLARAIHFDESDRRVFSNAARTGEWCIAGGFEFSDWTEGDLVGKARQAFSNGWLGTETFGRVTFVAVTVCQPAEHEAAIDRLAQHFVDVYGAPSVDAARPVAKTEIDDMVELCEDHDPNTLLTVSRELTGSGVRESFRTIHAPDADLTQVAIHGSLDEDG